jgi:hypothetical protein
MNTRFTSIRDTVVSTLILPGLLEIKKGETIDCKACEVYNYGASVHVRNEFSLNRVDWQIVHYTDR